MSDTSSISDSAGFDPTVPNVARVYDYLLGGKDNFAADRVLAQELLENFPPSAWRARENRAFVGRAVRYCADRGLRQFLDVGSGLPTMDNVHEVARRISPGAAVVYVDNDPVTHTHANALLATSPGVAAILGDVRDPGRVLAEAGARGLDLNRPVVVLLAAILHFITDEEDPASIVRAFRDAMVPGSYLVLSHAIDVRSDETERVHGIYSRASSPLVTRAPAEIAAFFTGLELVDPGLVLTTQWRPEGPIRDAETAGMLAGVGYKYSVPPAG